MKNLPVLYFPLIFVLLWSTGFIGARYGLPYAGPFEFLFVRMLITVALLLIICAFSRIKLPERPKDIFHSAVAGILLHGLYLGGVFFAVSVGMPAGIVSLIVSFQSVLTAFAAAMFLRERMSFLQWGGFILGAGGMYVTLFYRSNYTVLPDFSVYGIPAITAALISMLSITAGTVYQKKFCADGHPFANILVQYATSSLFFALPAFIYDDMQFNLTPEFIFSLIWLSGVLSVGAVGILVYLLKQKAALNVTVFFFLVPPVTAVEGFFMFGETFSKMQIIGIFVCIAGVAVVNTQGIRRFFSFKSA